MPITKELDNINELEAVGFNHNQAKTLARIIEKAQFDSQQDLKEFIHNEIKDLRNIDIANIHAELKLIRMEFKADIEKSLKDLLVKIFAIVFGVSGVLFTALKLFG